MRRRLVCSLLMLGLAACGPSPQASGDDAPDGAVADLPDTDGDGIADEHEDRAGNVDTDSDGTPDYLDDDSDGDGVPDYREAGDESSGTPPYDSDGDGVPDFRDTDADGNGRADGIDGAGDLDGDGRPDFADLDDDGDHIDDTLEIGNPLSPIDNDNDGTPDFHDTDSDNDTIEDLSERAEDYDSDGTGNWRDKDADGDCIPDMIEAGGRPPRDTDSDHRPDFVDRDSDGDGLLDGAEDANCNGTRDDGESSNTSGDTDGDGVGDMIEDAAGTNPGDPADNPQAHGNFVFIVPYQEDPAPRDDDLDFQTRLQALDMYVLVDRSGSMSSEISTVRDNLATVVDHLQCPPLGSGSADTCIPDLWAGAGTVGYQNGSPFANYTDIQDSPSFGGLPTTEPGGSGSKEPLVFAAWAAITGNGTAQASGCTYGASVVQRTSCASSPAGLHGYQAYGYPCFRNGALPVVLLATDEPALTQGDTYECPSWADAKGAFTARSAKLVGILGSDSVGTTVDTDLQTMAKDTGAIDAAHNDKPLVFEGANTGSATAIENGIRTLAAGVPLDIAAAARDEAGDTVDAVVSFVDHLQTLQLGTADCEDGLTEEDTNNDGYPDYYVDVRAGTPVCWKLFAKSNTTVPAKAEPQLFRANVDVTGDGVTILDTRAVFFLVPPRPADEPID